MKVSALNGPSFSYGNELSKMGPPGLGKRTKQSPFDSGTAPACMLGGSLAFVPKPHSSMFECLPIVSLEK